MTTVHQIKKDVLVHPAQTILSYSKNSIRILCAKTVKLKLRGVVILVLLSNRWVVISKSV
jgi:hypothetical protein